MKYMSLQHIWNLSQLLGLSTCCKTCKCILKLCHWNVETTSQNYNIGVDCVAKNWALAMMLKALPLVHIWSILLMKEQVMTSVRKTLKMLVWSAQNWSISSKSCPKNNHKISCIYWLLFTEVCPENSRKISRFFHEFVPKSPPKFDFCSRNLSEALSMCPQNKENDFSYIFVICCLCVTHVVQL